MCGTTAACATVAMASRAQTGTSAELKTASGILRAILPAQQVGQLGNVHRDPPWPECS
jgi:hypothetical protein